VDECKPVPYSSRNTSLRKTPSFRRTPRAEPTSDSVGNAGSAAAAAVVVSASAAAASVAPVALVSIVLPLPDDVTPQNQLARTEILSSL
jgi:hypothetical protein